MFISLTGLKTYLESNQLIKDIRYSYLYDLTTNDFILNINISFDTLEGFASFSIASQRNLLKAKSYKTFKSLVNDINKIEIILKNPSVKNIIESKIVWAE